MKTELFDWGSQIVAKNSYIVFVGSESLIPVLNGEAHALILKGLRPRCVEDDLFEGGISTVDLILVHH